MASRFGVKLPAACPSCTLPYTDPKVLPCFHILCRECAGGLIILGMEKVRCPVEMCRKEFVIENNDTETLPDALPVYYERDLSSFKNKMASGNENCRHCIHAKKIAVPASSVCDICNFICQKCAVTHRQKTEFSDHEVTSILELSQSNNDVMHHDILKRSRSLSFNQRGKCSERQHYKEVATSYCMECSKFLCPLCDKEHHRAHNVVSTSVAAEQCKKSLGEKLPNVRVVHKRVAAAAHDVKNAKTNVADQKEVLTSSIEHGFSRIFRILERRQQDMIKQLSGLAEDKGKRLTAQEESLKNLASQFQRLEEYIDATVHMSTDYELLKTFGFLERQCHDVLQEGSKVPIQPVEFPNLAVKNSSESHIRELCLKHMNVIMEQASPSSCSAEGSGLRSAQTEKFAHFKVAVVDKNNKPCPSSQNVSATLTCIENDFTLSAVIAESSTSNYDVSYCPQFRGRHDLAVSVNNNEIPGSPFHIVVTKPPQELGLSRGVISDITGPRGIVISRSNNILICSWNGHKIIEIDLIGRQIREFGQGQLYNPANIAIGREGHLYVTDAASENCLYKFDETGRLVKMAGRQGKRDGEFLKPRGLSVTTGNEVWVCDRDNHRIQIFDSDLNFRSTIDLSNVDPQLVERPQPNDLAFDYSGNFFVTDYANQCILCFTPSKEYLMSFSGYDSSNRILHGPECITIDSTDLLYVTDSRNHSVSIFKTNGEVVKTFGSLGKKEGEFKFPMGVAVDKNGSVFVAEMINSRIQMF